MLRSFSNTTNVGTEDGSHHSWMKTGPQSAKSSTRGVEGAECDKLYFMFVDMNKAVNVRHPRGNSRDCQGESRRVLRLFQRAAHRVWGCGSAGIVGQTHAESNTGLGRSVAKSGGMGRRWLVDGRSWTTSDGV